MSDDKSATGVTTRLSGSGACHMPRERIVQAVADLTPGVTLRVYPSAVWVDLEERAWICRKAQHVGGSEEPGTTIAVTRQHDGGYVIDITALRPDLIWEPRDQPDRWNAADFAPVAAIRWRAHDGVLFQHADDEQQTENT